MAVFEAQCSAVGSFGYSQYFKLYVELTETNISIENNTSQIQYNVYCKSSGSGSISANHLKYFNINGTNVINKTEKVDVTSPNAYISIASGTTGAIAHNADGSKSVSFSAKIQGATYGVTAEINNTFTLSTIPRASTPTVSGTTIGSAMTITTNRASSNFTHTLTYKIGSLSGTIATGVGASTSWTIPKTLANAIPSSTSGVLYITCTTYNGSTNLGSKEISCTINVPDTAEFRPSISSVSLTEAVSGLASKFGFYVQNQSKLNGTITATGAYSSTIKSYSININGATYTNRTFTTGILTTSGTNSYSVTVSDSRGRSATYNGTFSVTAYVSPFISTFTVTRCDSAGNADEGGAYAKVVTAGSIYSLSGKNTQGWKLEYKKSSATSYTEYTLPSVNSTVTGIAVDVNSSYTFRLTLWDYFTDNVSLERTLGTGFTLLNINPSGKGIAFGKVSEKDEFECNMVADFKNTISWESIGYTNTDYNTMKKSGIYYMSTGCANSPEGQSYLRLLVMGASYSGDIVQIATNVVTGNTWIRTCSNGTWHDWAKVGTAVKKATQTSTAGWYRVAILRGAGHNPNNAVILNISTNYNYNAPCSVMLAIITSYRQARITQLTALDTNNDPVITQARVQYDETNANFYVDVYYNKSTLNAILVRNENILDKQTEIYAPYLLSSSSLTNVDTLEIDYTGTRLSPKLTLYNNTSGSTGTITLSESSVNISELEIYYGDTVSGTKDFIKVSNPNGATINTSVLSQSGESIRVNTRKLTISGTTITPSDYQVNYVPNGSKYTSNEQAIYKVIGYK